MKLTLTIKSHASTEVHASTLYFLQKVSHWFQKQVLEPFGLHILNILSSFSLRDFFCCDPNHDFLPGKKPILYHHHFAHLKPFLWGGQPAFLKLFPEVGGLAFTLGLGEVTIPRHSLPYSKSSSIAWRCVWVTVMLEDQMMVQLSVSQHQQRHTSSSTLHSGNHACRNHLLTFLGLTKTWQLQPKTSLLRSFIHSKDKCPVDRPRSMFLCSSPSINGWFTKFPLNRLRCVLELWSVFVVSNLIRC